MRIPVIVAALVVTWVLLVYIAGLSIIQETYEVCPICRVHRIITTYFMVPVSIEINESEFSRYYRSHADPQHQHIWLKRGVSRKTRTGDISAHGIPDPLRLQYNAALAIIKSLPDRKTRKAFSKRLYVPDRSSPEAQRVLKAIQELNNAYWENEQRKDWPIQLRKVGLYPNTESGKHQ